MRRFGTDWIKIAEAEADQVLALSLPALSGDESVGARFHRPPADRR